MKKNKMMRIASILMVATLITTCAISGTFAKYVTKVSGEDTARVAKWGIVLDVQTTGAFDDRYVTHDADYEGEFSVMAYNATDEEKGDKLVAPGTSSDDLDMSFVASVKGTPEVATRYTLEGTVTDVVLPAGTYTDYTELVINDEDKYGYFNTFDLAADYAPVKWNLVISGKGQEINVADALYENLPDNLIEKAEAYGLTPNGCSFFDAVTILTKVAGNDTYVQVVEGALANIVSGGSNFVLEADKEAGTFKLGYDFDPNKEMDFTFELSWEWAFEQVVPAEGAEALTDDEAAQLAIFDAADTLLGNIAAGVVEAPEGASINIAAALTAKAVQID